MSRKEVISEKTLLTWILLSAVSTGACLLLTAIIIYIVFGCWIMYQHNLAGGSCNIGIEKEIVFAIPIILGFVIGTILTRKSVIAENKQ